MLILDSGCGKTNTSDKEDNQTTTSWTRPIQITKGSGFNTFNSAMEKDGSAILVYSRYAEESEVERVYAVVYLPQSGWGDAGVIDGSADNGDAYRPVAAFNPEGEALTVFTQGDGSNDRVYARWYRKGIGWEDGVTAIDGDEEGSSGEPQIAFDSSGNAMVVFTKSEGLWVTHYDEGNDSWDTPLLFNPSSSGGVTSPEIIYIGSGEFLVTFYQWDSSVDMFRLYAITFNGQSWDPSPVQIDSDFHNFFDATLVADGFGNAMVIFTEGEENRVIAKRYLKGWIGTYELGFSSGKGLDAAYDSNHNVIALFVQKENGIDRIFAAGYIGITDKWLNAEAIDGGGGNADNPGIVFDSQDNGIVVYSEEVFSEELDYDVPRIFAVHYDTVTGWGGPLIIDGDATSSASIPQIIIDWNDQPMVLFARPDPGSGQIYSVQYK